MPKVMSVTMCEEYSRMFCNSQSCVVSGLKVFSIILFSNFLEISRKAVLCKLFLSVSRSILIEFFFSLQLVNPMKLFSEHYRNVETLTNKHSQLKFVDSC